MLSLTSNFPLVDRSVAAFPVRSNAANESPALSHFSGPPLAEETGLGPLTLPGYIAELARRHPNREAVVFHDPDGTIVRWTYSELYERSCQVARCLIATGLPKHGFVAVLMSNRPEWLTSVFGILLAGGTAVPLSTFSTPAELAHLIKASCATTLLLESRVLQKDFAAMLVGLEPRLAECAPGRLQSVEFPFLGRVVAVGECGAVRAIERWDDFLAAGDSLDDFLVEARSASVAPGDPGMLYFSSGSTGVPKGILNSQRGVAIQLWRWPRFLDLPVDGSVRGWGANGFFWSGAFAQAAGAVFSCGGTLVLQSTFDPEAALALFEAEKINYLTCWPHQYVRMAEAPNFIEADLSSLKYITRGTPIESHPSIATDWVEPVWSYGSTETFTINCGVLSDRTYEKWGNTKGSPLPGNSVKVVDPLTGETQPIGRSGEIAVKGPTLMLGYVGMATNSLLDGQGFFHTGDGGFFDDQGRLSFEGRLNDIIKTGGANVSPLEIDRILTEADEVKLSQTVGVPDRELGQMIVSCIVAAEGRTPDIEILRNDLKSQLASYKIPRRILIIDEKELSFTGSAKVRTAALIDIAQRRLEK